ncbi:PEBP-like protein [Crepidotus variabilis]|uniref:PEBP-like protein n=1 Tax=Crepidotus variabilis TaxID=179855 RepID=A0A9P6JU86_9AGAR|nr:PEBP-like protein [Crepidotus variabilis]
MLLTVLVSVAFLRFVIAQDTSIATVKRAFEKAKLPQALGLEFNPKCLLEVVFHTNVLKAPIPVTAGMTIFKNDTTIRPTFSLAFPNHRNVDTLEASKVFGRGPFVICMLDPDAPTPQNTTLGPVRHFLATDFYINPDASGFQLVNKTPAINNWNPPNPTKGVDAHRYAIFLFKQPPQFDGQSLINATTPIIRWNISQFVNSTGLGQPIGGTFMMIAPVAPAFDFVISLLV